MRTSNPAFSEAALKQFEFAGSSTMTVQGAVNKTGFLTILLTISAGWVWYMFHQAVAQGGPQAGAQAVMPWMWLGIIGGFILCLVTIFATSICHITSPIYAVFEGLFIGGISAILDARYGGIVIQAVALTFGTLFCMLLAYTAGVVRATERFKTGVIAATGGIFIVYLVSIILGLFGISIPLIHGSGVIGIGFSVFVVIIAALNLVLDFDFIERGARQGAPKQMEWYGAFGLLVTLVWLYIEILRLLVKLRGRD